MSGWGEDHRMVSKCCQIGEWDISFFSTLDSTGTFAVELLENFGGTLRQEWQQGSERCHR